MVLVVTLIAAGLLFTHVLAHGRIGHWDDHVSSWFAHHRSPGWNRVTEDFTLLADTLGVVAVAALVTVVLLVRGWGKMAMLLIIGLVVELAVFLPTNYAVARPRPSVPHVGGTPSTYSWPSGHTAATLTLYGGIAVLVMVATRRRFPRVVAWLVAVALTVCVALSRIYRGEHHPTDTMAGAVLGVGAVCAAVLTIRAWKLAAEAHRAPSSPPSGRVAERADWHHGGSHVTSVGVIAHRKKSFGGGLSELRRLLADRGFPEPIWYEVSKSRKAPAMARQAVEDGADLLLLWGGDGTVQRCVDALAGANVSLAVMPAGTANLLANNLGIPTDLAAALDIALHGARRPIDVGVLNGERFAVMAGAGLDAIMMSEADAGLKDRFGRVAYVWTGARATRSKAVKMSVKVDGKSWFKGRATCLLLGNMGTLTGGLTAFPHARPDDGLLEVGVVTAQGPLQWARVLSRLVAGTAERSKLVRMTRGNGVDIKLSRATAYELDGGARSPKRRMKARIEPGAIIVCVPESTDE